MRKPRANGAVQVSDHAVVRYLERVGGFDIDSIKTAIAARVGAGAQAGASSVVVDGFVFCIGRCDQGPVVTTVLIKGRHTIGHIPLARQK